MSSQKPEEAGVRLCRMCQRQLTEQESLLGLGRCRDCARKCESEVSFDTVYGNTEKQGEKTNKSDSVAGSGTAHRPAGSRAHSVEDDVRPANGMSLPHGGTKKS